MAIMINTTSIIIIIIIILIMVSQPEFELGEDFGVEKSQCLSCGATHWIIC